MAKITNFTDELSFLDNTATCAFEHEGLLFLSVTSACLAHRYDDTSMKRKISTMPSYKAKDYVAGRAFADDGIRQVRKHMTEEEALSLLHSKFDENEDDQYIRELQRLTDNGDEFEYHNMEHDNLFGICDCARCGGKRGRNLLGSFLTTLRSRLE